MESQYPGRHDILVKRRAPGNHVDSIPDTNRAADPLRFPIYFPTGKDGWSAWMKYEEKEDNGSRRRSRGLRRDTASQQAVEDEEGGNEEAAEGNRVTVTKFYRFHLQMRLPYDGPANILLRYSRFFPLYFFKIRFYF